MFPLALLAETRTAEISQQYREATADAGGSGLWMLAVPFIAVGVAFIVYKVFCTKPDVVYDHDSLMGELCRAHKLNAAAAKLIHTLAETAGVQQPAWLFLGETNFDQIVEQAERSGDVSQANQASIAMLRRRLFGSDKKAA